MTNRLKLLSIFFGLLSFVGLFFFAPHALAQANFQQAPSVNLPKGTVINDNYFAAGQTSTVSGTVNGDAYVAGGNVTIDGTINGDLFVGGGNVNMKGNVTGNLRVAGGQVTVSGNVAKNILALGGQIIISDTAKVGGSLTAAGGSIDVAAPLGKSVQAAGGQLTISNNVPGNVVFSGGMLTLSSGANVGGSVIYYSNNNASVDPAAKVAGGITKRPLPQRAQAAPRVPAQAIAAFFTFWAIVNFISTLAIGLIFIYLFKKLSLNVTDLMGARFLGSLGIGFLAVILAPIVFFVLLATLIGIPLAFLEVGFFFIVSYFARILASLFVGQLVLERFTKQTSLGWSFLLGLVIYSIVGFLPVLGWLAKAVVDLAALGAILWQTRLSYQEANK